MGVNGFIGQMGWYGMGLLANRVGLGWNGFTGHPLTAADEERAFQFRHRQPPWRFYRRAEAVEVEENKSVPVIRTRRANQGELVSTHHHQPCVQKRLPVDHAVIVLLHDEQGSDAPAKLIVAQVHGEEAQVDVQVKRPDPKIKAKPYIIYRIKSPAQYMLHQVESRVIQSFI